jgi:ribosomal protein S20
MQGKTKIIVAGVLVVALLALGVGGAVVLAQGPTPTPPKGGKAGIGQLYLQALANRLGTTLDKLQQAMSDARKDAIDNAVKQGLITQAQADKMLQRLQNPPTPPPGKAPFPAGKAFGAARGFFGPDVLEAVAKVLNMSPADVTSALRSGKTLADLAKSQNVDPSKVQQAIADAEKAALDRAVKDGLMTQAQADALKAKIDPNKIDLSRPRWGGAQPPGRGRFFGPGWFGRFGSPLPTPTPKSS